MWSLGCVLYEIATLQPPFKANDMDGLFKKVLKGSYPQIPECYSEDLAKVIKRLINVNASTRPSCDQLLKSQVITKWAKHLEMDLTESSPSKLMSNDNDS
jgi:NIMA (never in mitosis gene a)-related kinase 1/4/5